jgi:hypothetical protein
MKREDIIQMAREAGFEADPDNVWITDGYWFEELARFAALVAAAEREACAKVCDSLEEQCEKLGLSDEKWPTPADCAFVIRARSQA